MARTEEMVVIDTKIPDPDSQFRLRPCSCSSVDDMISPA